MKKLLLVSCLAFHSWAAQPKPIILVILADELTKLNITDSFTIVPGVGHDTLALLKGLGDANWDFYRTALSAVDVPPQPSP